MMLSSERFTKIRLLLQLEILFFMPLQIRFALVRMFCVLMFLSVEEVAEEWALALVVVESVARADMQLQKKM